MDLHDSIEDTSAGPAYLIGAGVPQSVVDIVQTLTHFKEEPNTVYWKRIRNNPPAVLVKLCDVWDNLDPSRMCYLPHEAQSTAP